MERDIDLRYFWLGYLYLKMSEPCWIWVFPYFLTEETRISSWRWKTREPPFVHCELSYIINFESKQKLLKYLFLSMCLFQIVVWIICIYRLISLKTKKKRKNCGNWQWKIKDQSVWWSDKYEKGNVEMMERPNESESVLRCIA